VARKKFSAGKDNDKDSCFNGTANKFPSVASLWSGKTIIQAKHTTTLNASCSDRKFSVNETSVLTEELDKLKNGKTYTIPDKWKM